MIFNVKTEEYQEDEISALFAHSYESNCMESLDLRMVHLVEVFSDQQSETTESTTIWILTSPGQATHLPKFFLGNSQH
jgi:hypothetical protein